mmetsp:Transcript_48279/g.159989  ORF Transcript_48279/g.159989 Transcript_48279/m.159989 type:complete len:200 (+) Transcript_48279:186-785(+)
MRIDPVLSTLRHPPSALCSRPATLGAIAVVSGPVAKADHRASEICIPAPVPKPRVQPRDSRAHRAGPQLGDEGGHLVPNHVLDHALLLTEGGGVAPARGVEAASSLWAHRGRRDPHPLEKARDTDPAHNILDADAPVAHCGRPWARSLRGVPRLRVHSCPQLPLPHQRLQRAAWAVEESLVELCAAAMLLREGEALRVQ